MELDGFKDLEQQRQAREDFFEKAFDPTYIEKGKRGGTGEIREWKDGKYQKQSDGTWKPVKEEGEKSVKNKPVGSTHEHNGKKYKKQSNGKWLEVSEQGETKASHIYQTKYAKEESKKPSLHTSKHEDAERWHREQASKLSDKEHTDEEVMGGEKKYTNKDLEGYGDYKIQDHKDSIQSHIDDIKSGKDKEHNLKFIEIHKELLKRKTPDFKDAPHHQENLKKYLTEVDNKLESAKLHSEQASKLFDKEHTDEEVGLGSKKNN